MLDLALKKLDVWKKSLKIVSSIYTLKQKFRREEQFGLTSQLRRASVSVISNIAEGFARSSEIETRRFLDIARSSLVEIDTHLEIANELKLINENLLGEIENILNELFAKLSNLIEKAR